MLSLVKKKIYIMKLTFTLHDMQEISITAYLVFISTFKYQVEESDSDFSYESSGSDLSDFDDAFGCGEITPEVENMVESNWEICHPIEKIYGEAASELIKETVTKATEESQCAELKFFRDITLGEDRDLITTCTEIRFWCCCQTVKKVSPILAEATTNLMY